MALNEQNRKQLAKSLLKMKQSGESPERMEMFANAFSKKHSQAPTIAFKPEGLDATRIVSRAEKKGIEKAEKNLQKWQTLKQMGVVGPDPLTRKEPTLETFLRPKKSPGLTDLAKIIEKRPFTKTFVHGATAGLSDPIVGGLSAGITKAFLPKKYTEGKSFGDLYKRFAGEQKEKREKDYREAPIESLGGALAGIASPGGVYSQASKLIRGSTALPVIGTTAKEAPLALKALQGFIRGGGAAGIYGGTEKLAEKLSGRKPERSVLADIAMGGLIEGGAPVVGRGLQQIGKSIKSGVIPGAIRGAIESIPGIGGLKKGARETAERESKQAYEALKEQMGSQYDLAKDLFKQKEIHRAGLAKASKALEKEAAISGFKGLRERPTELVAEKLAENIKGASQKMGKEYGEIVTPIINKYRLKKVATKPVLEKLDDILGRSGLKDLDPEEADLLKKLRTLDPEAKKFFDKIEELGDSLGKKDEVSIGFLKQAIDAVSPSAKFGADTRSQFSKMFAEIRYNLKDLMENAIEKYAGSNELKKFKEAKKVFASKKSILDEAEKLVGYKKTRYPERLARTLGSAIPASAMKRILKLDPGSKKELGDLFINFLTEASRSPAEYTKQINYFGRPFLKNLLGPNKFSGLEKYEEALHAASVPWRVGFKPGVIPKKPPMPKPPGDQYWKGYKTLEKILSREKETAPFLRALPQLRTYMNKQTEK